MRAGDQKQKYDLEWPNRVHVGHGIRPIAGLCLAKSIFSVACGPYPIRPRLQALCSLFNIGLVPGRCMHDRAAHILRAEREVQSSYYVL